MAKQQLLRRAAGLPRPPAAKAALLVPQWLPSSARPAHSLAVLQTEQPDLRECLTLTVLSRKAERALPAEAGLRKQIMFRPKLPSAHLRHPMTGLRSDDSPACALLVRAAASSSASNRPAIIGAQRLGASCKSTLFRQFPGNQGRIC